MRKTIVTSVLQISDLSAQTNESNVRCLRRRNNIIFNVNGGYIRSDGLIESRDYAIYDSLIEGEGDNPSLVYTTYENVGISNIATSNCVSGRKLETDAFLQVHDT